MAFEYGIRVRQIVTIAVVEAENRKPPLQLVAGEAIMDFVERDDVQAGLTRLANDGFQKFGVQGENSIWWEWRSMPTTGGIFVSCRDCFGERLRRGWLCFQLKPEQSLSGTGHKPRCPLLASAKTDSGSAARAICGVVQGVPACSIAAPDIRHTG